MSLTISNSNYSPFPDRDTFQYYCVKHLDLPDIARAARVCKRWNQMFSDQNLWKVLFEKEGIPLVISANGAARNHKEDFKTLYPITLSGKIISQFIGKVVEKIPPITEARFNELKEPDPFETGKVKSDTFMFIVDPSFVTRSVNKETPLALDEKGNLIESSNEESEQNPESTSTKKLELKISLSLKNIKALSSYPLNGNKNMPVFSQHCYDNAIGLCNTCPDKISVYFMRIFSIGQSKGKGYDEQEMLVKPEGFRVTPLRVRVLFNTVSILKEGACHDAENSQLVFSRHPEMVNYGNGVYHPVVGGFAHGDGVRVVLDRYIKKDLIGVVPGKPADVSTLEA